MTLHLLAFWNRARICLSAAGRGSAVLVRVKSILTETLQKKLVTWPIWLIVVFLAVLVPFIGNFLSHRNATHLPDFFQRDYPQHFVKPTGDQRWDRNKDRIKFWALPTKVAPGDVFETVVAWESGEGNKTEMRVCSFIGSWDPHNILWSKRMLKGPSGKRFEERVALKAPPEHGTHTLRWFLSWAYEPNGSFYGDEGSAPDGNYPRSANCYWSERNFVVEGDLVMAYLRWARSHPIPALFIIAAIVLKPVLGLREWIAKASNKKEKVVPQHGDFDKE